MTQNILLKAIRCDGNTQSRAALNMETVADYTQVLQAGGTLPPVVLFKDDETYWPGDGFHRIHAYMADKRASIPADVHTGTQRDARLYACGANASHGLRRSVADKNRAVSMMLADSEWAQLSDRKIAEHCGVSHTFVANLRNPKPSTPPAPPAVAAAAPAPVVSPPPPPLPPAESGNVATQTAAPAATPASAPAPAPPPAAAAAAKIDAQQLSEDAHGDTDLAQLLEDAHAEVDRMQKLLDAAAADDQKAETLKWRRIADTAARRQEELQLTVAEKGAELKRLASTLARIGRAVGEEDASKVAATVEMFVRTAKVAA